MDVNDLSDDDVREADQNKSTDGDGVCNKLATDECLLDSAEVLQLVTAIPHRFLPCELCSARYMPWPCVCLGPSVTSRCCTKMAKHRNTQTMPHNSIGTPVF